MSHHVESAFFVRTPAWHRLGVVLPEAPSVREAIRHARLDWSVRLDPVAAIVNGSLFGTGRVLPSDIAVKELESHRAVVRASDDSVLGVVGAGYTPLQNDKAFAFFEPFVASGACSLEVAGSLKGGRRVWVLARINGTDAEVVDRDAVRGYFLLSTAHDGSQAVRCQYTTIRVVCWNTLSRADRRADAGLEDCVRVRHTAKVEAGLALVRRTVDMASRTFAATVDDFRRMAGKRLPVDGLQKYVDQVLGIAPDTYVRGKKPRAYVQILEAYYNAPGSTLGGVRDTYWGAYNALTDWVDHRRGRAGGDGPPPPARVGGGGRPKRGG